MFAINIISFAVCGADKAKAVKRKFRVPEKTLFLLSMFGGAFGFYMGMLVFRHKTKHLRFSLGIPLLALVWVMLIVLYAVKAAPFLP